jgi:acyl-CoA reductase-like NAD-dependent aldehyde dehydrogenase/alcohol dehydrogenase class IV
MKTWRLLIDGDLTQAADGREAVSCDPGSGEPVGRYAHASAPDVEAAVAAARRAFDQGPWPGLSPDQRGRLLVELADAIMARSSEFALLESRDSGGLRTRTHFDVTQGTRFMRRMARLAATEFPWREPLPKGSPLVPARNYIRREPIGVCAAVIPWNFPLLMALWKISMAVVMGNTLVLKPAPATPLSALLLGEVIAAAGFPPGVINILAGPDDGLGERLLRHPLVDRVAFTGRPATGRGVLAAASETLKRVTLELGGKSANIVLEDADLDMALEGALFAAFLHAGQTCEAGTRLILHEAIAEDFLERLVARARAIRVGYQLDPDTVMGPVISAEHAAAIERHIIGAQREGAVLRCGGERVSVPGFPGGHYLAPTIFSQVTPGMALAREEVFGPVLAVMTCRNDEDAAALANASDYGLAAGIWSRTVSRAENLAARLRAGTVWINDWHAFHECGPFGGYRRSGLGRELGLEGLHAYTEVKHVHVGTEGEARAKLAHRALGGRAQPLGYDHAAPVRVICGPGAIARLASETCGLAEPRYLLITDPGVQAAGLVDRVLAVVGADVAAIFRDVPSDSGLDVADAAAEAGRRAGTNAVLSLGGGSVLDTGKAVSLAMGLRTRAGGLTGMFHLAGGRRLPHTVVPTTAGTGSEATDVIVLRHERLGIKTFILDPLVTPDLAILDPLLTLTLPPLTTAATGLDALTHALEALASRKANPIASAHALHACRLIAANLPAAVRRGNEAPARTALLSAAHLAGLAIADARVGLAHALAHAVGIRHGVHHGLANGILLPHVIRWNSAQLETAERYREAAAAMRVDLDPTLPAERVGERLAEGIDALLRDCGHPRRFSELGLPRTDMALCASLALSDPAIWTTPRTPESVREVEGILEASW